MTYIESYWFIKTIPLISDFVEGVEHELMNKINCSAKLWNFANNNIGIAKIDIITVKRITQLKFSIQKLYTLLDTGVSALLSADLKVKVSSRSTELMFTINQSSPTYSTLRFVP